MKCISLISGLLAVGLAGCAVSPEQQERLTFLQTQAASPVTCDSPNECDQKWQRSAQWLKRNAYWKIQTFDDTRIETRKPTTHHSSRNWYRVNKLPQSDGSTVISMYATCLPSIHCVPETELAVGAFNYFVNTGTKY